ncbi:MAG: hypothetical protein VKL59_03370 [Nostocaceae cyanobacterium]|nr:hypothetical protein [Nostocaceae cyanobacterium]
MKVSLSPVTRIILTSVASIAATNVFILNAAFANPSADQLENNYTGQTTSNPWSPENDSTPIGGLLDLINRVNSNNKVLDSAAQRQQIDEEANNFLQRRQQMLNSQPPTVPSQPNTTTQPSGN